MAEPEAGGECPAPRRQSGAVESAVTQPWLSAAAAAPLRQPPVPTSAARCLPGRSVPFSLLLLLSGCLLLPQLPEAAGLKPPPGAGSRRQPGTLLEGAELAVLVRRLPGCT